MVICLFEWWWWWWWKQTSDTESLLEGKKITGFIFLHFRLIMSLSSIVRHCYFRHHWTFPELHTRCQRRISSVWSTAATQSKSMKKITTPKRDILTPSVQWFISYLVGRHLHATQLHLQEVMLTSERYDVQRLPFATVSDADLSFFEHLMPDRVVTASDELKSFNVDWLKSMRGGLF